MDKKSTYGLKPEQLGRLLSIGSKGAKSVEAKSKDKTGKKKPPPSKSHPPQDQESNLSADGPQIEGYEILGKLGEAGQGQVWRALQVSTSRQVALKVPRTRLISSEKILARFEREIEVAARLRHPNIARIHDSGIHHGMYYYAMDLVEGMHLDQYVKKHKLTIRQILELMRIICQAVQYTHQNGVIHRDLKPSNVVVTEDGEPFIVDFGLAKNLLEDDLNITVSGDGETCGTPAYMSPEQASGHTDKLDTRTDVYSLGVILFALLTGESPHDLSGTRYEVIRRISEERVRRPRKICPRIDKELELLLLKALDNDPDRRYVSAGGLAQDIENYLTGAPLIAGPPGAVYRLNKAIRRHKALVAGILAVLMVSVIGTIVSVVFAVGQARARAETQAVVDFLTQDVLGSAQKVKGRDATVIDVLDAATAKLDEGNFKDQPSVEAYVCWTLADIYKSLGYAKLALPQRSRACQISKEHNVPVGSYDLNYTMNFLALSYLNAGEYQKAESLFKELIQLNEPGKTGLYNFYKLNLVAVYKEQGRYKEAQDLCLELMQTAWWKRKPIKQLARGVKLLGQAYHGQGLYDQAEQTFMNVLDYDPNALQVSRALLYVDMKRYNEAEEFLTEAIQITRDELPGKGHPVTLWAVSILAVLRTLQGRHDEAADLFTEALAGQELKIGNDNPVTLRTVNGFGVLRREQKQYEQAESLLRRALKGRKLKLGHDHPACFESMHELAILYKEQARYEEAEKLLVEAVEGRRLKLGVKHPHTVESLKNLIELYEVWNKPKKVKEWRTKLPLE